MTKVLKLYKKTNLFLWLHSGSLKSCRRKPTGTGTHTALGLIEVIFDLLEAAPDPTTQLDVCIVGAGAAGVTLAVELARLGKSVYLLEGGGATVESATQEPYRGSASGLNHRGLHDGRFRTLGGTTTRWGGQILELDAIDFQPRPWVDGSGWPIAKSELTHFYRRAETLEGISSAIRSDSEVWSKVGMTPPIFPGLLSYLSRWCPEPNFSVLHKHDLDGPAIHVWLHANAVELNLDEETAVGVRASTQNGSVATFRARQYVFCMGAIESSRFFLQPHGQQLPWNRSGLLGKHFQDHIDCNVGRFHPTSRHALHRCFDSLFLKQLKYQPKVKLPAEEQQNAGTLNVAGTMSFESDMAETMTDMRTTAKQILRGRLLDVRANDIRRMIRHSPALMQQAWRYAANHRSFQPANSTIAFRVHCEQEPCSASTITLSDERDSLGLLRTRLSWQVSKLELKTIRHFAAIATKALASLGELHLTQDIEDDDALTAICEDSFHHMGGMRMSSSPLQGVVDTNLKLHGVQNAYVCSSAVFPSSGFSNPTHTLLALTVRLADHLVA